MAARDITHKNNALTRLGSTGINKLMLEFVLPSIISITLSAVYNIIDALFLGQAMGDIGLAATQAAFPITMVIGTLICLPGFGGVTVVSLHLGANRRRESEQALGNTTTISLVLCAICTIAGLAFMTPLLTLGGATASIMPEATTFMSIMCLGIIPQGIFLNLNNFIRAAGSPNRALIYNGSGMLACIVLNFLFVTIAGWGVAGSALATIIGQAFSAVLIVVYLAGKKSVLKLHLKDLRLDFTHLKPIINLGIPQSLSQLMFSASTFLLNYQFVIVGSNSALGPEGALAAIGLISRIGLLSMFILFGVSIGAQPLMGYNAGAKEHRRLLSIFWIAVLWTVAFSTSFLIVAAFFAPQIVTVFGLSQASVALTAQLLVLYIAPLPISGFVVIVMCYYQAIGKVVLATLISVLKQGLVLVPALLIVPIALPALIPGIDSATAVILAIPLSEAITFLIAVPLFSVEFKKLTSAILAT